MFDEKFDGTFDGMFRGVFDGMIDGTFDGVFYGMFLGSRRLEIDHAEAPCIELGCWLHEISLRQGRLDGTG